MPSEVLLQSSDGGMSKKRGLPLKASYPKSYVLYLKGSKKGPAIFFGNPHVVCRCRDSGLVGTVSGQLHYMQNSRQNLRFGA